MTGFVAGTLVHTEKGLVPIQEINVGDRVLSRSESGGGNNFQRICKIVKNIEKASILLLTYIDNYINIEDSLEHCTLYAEF